MLSQRSHLNALGSEDELGHHRRDVGLVKHGVGDALQQRLHGSHAVQENTSAQVAVVKQQEDQPRAHLARTGRMTRDQNIHTNTTVSNQTWMVKIPVFLFHSLSSTTELPTNWYRSKGHLVTGYTYGLNNLQLLWFVYDMKLKRCLILKKNTRSSLLHLSMSNYRHTLIILFRK